MMTLSPDFPRFPKASPSPPPAARQAGDRFRYPLMRAFLLSVLALVSGCDLGTGPAPVPAALEIVDGADQTATVGAPVPTAPAVRLLNRKGRPMPGREVVFFVTSGGGSITGNVATTGSDGVAQLGTWMLGPRSGIQSIQARVPELAPLTVTATAVPAEPATLTIQAGNSQVGVVAGALGVSPSVRVKDRYGNANPGVSVSFQVTEGGGFLSGPSGTTDTNGRADAGIWTLGTTPGANALTAEVEGLDPVSFSATALADAPSRVTVLLGDDQTGVVDEGLPLKPTITVADRFWNLLEGVAVRFTVTSGGGSVGGDETITGPGGVAVSGTWILGPEAGEQNLAIFVADLEPVVLKATALAGLPAHVSRLSPDSQVASVASSVAQPPRIRVQDVHGNPIEGLAVSFTPSGSPDPFASPGTLEGAVAVTDSEGVAGADSWILGTVAGAYEATANVPGMENGVVFKAQALPGPPASLVPMTGDGQASLGGTPLAIPLGLRVTDAFGNGVAGAAVTFAVTNGGGSLGDLASPGPSLSTSVPVQTDAAGLARAYPWTLGPAPGFHEVTATVDGVPSLAFQAAALAGPAFDLEIEFMTVVDPSLLPAFSAAEARWEGIVVGDVPDLSAGLPAGGCQPVDEPAGLDDLKVYVTVGPIDGVGGVLGRAGPCYVRTPGFPLPLTGIMELDSEDLADLQANGMLEDVIVHEMGHILGFGTLWPFGSNKLLVGRGGPDPYFTGPGALAAFDVAGGAVRTKPKVPVENSGGGGTRDSHWRETVHESELMTGWIEGPGMENPLSGISVASMADLGYSVDMTTADPYLLSNPNGAPSRLGADHQRRGHRIFLRELLPPTPLPAPGTGRHP